MEQAIKADKVLDARGWSCTWSILKAKSALELMRPGEVLEVLSTDPMTLKDLPTVLGQSSHHLIQIDREAAFSRFYVRRGYSEGCEETAGSPAGFNGKQIKGGNNVNRRT